MSVDTRTPRTPTGGTARGFTDDEAVLNTVKVPSDPGQVIVNHVSFRVLLAGPAPHSAALETTRLRAARAVADAGAAPAGVGASSTRTGRRRAPIVWSGRTDHRDTGTTRLLQAVRVPPTGLLPTVPSEPADAATRTLPRIDGAPPTIVSPREPGPSETTQPLRTGARPVRRGYDGGPGGPGRTGPGGPAGGPPYEADQTATRPFPVFRDGGRDRDGDREAVATGEPPLRRNDPVRHAYYPGHRMNLGLVLLPLRIFLGFISVYAGMGKLCDPVYFDGGTSGSMVTWLRSLEPWTIATPLHEFALAHPVGAGLTVAFLQVVVGVLTIFGLWQRLAAGIGAALSLALLMTVSWRSVPVYDAPDLLYLAAWSPLLIAGAPVYSLDGRLAGQAWRTLGPRAPIWDLRRRVLQRGAVLVSVVGGLSMLVGAVLGGAVRSAEVPRVSEPGEPPVNHLPGSPLPQEPDGARASTDGPGASQADRTPQPTASSEGTPSGRTGDPGVPSQQETVRAPQQPSVPQAPEQPAAPSTTGTSSTGPTGEDGSAGGGTAAGGSTGGAASGGGEPDRSGALGGLLG